MYATATRPGSTPLPATVHSAADYARLAGEAMAPDVFAHVDGGSGRDVTAARNIAAFSRCAIVPRVLRDVTEGSTTCGLGGIIRPHPIFLAPVGWQKLLSSHDERAVAQAAAATGTCMIASTMSSITLEEIAAVADGDRWFQLYLQPDRAVSLDLVRRAEAADYTAIVVTVDTPIQLPGHRAIEAGFRPSGDPANLRDYPARLPHRIDRGASAIFNGFMRDAPVWGDIDWLAGQTRLPLWIKGIMHADDGREALDRGAAGLIVSNHGGRSLDGAPSSLSRLPGIRDALGPDAAILFDGGIRSGTDIFSAIALGADAVLVGRLPLYGLAVAGPLGVGHVIKLLQQELEACMALAGCATLDDIRRAEVIVAEPGA